MNVGGNTARPVPALLDLEAVGVEDAIEDRSIRTAWRLEDEGLVETDAGMAIGKLPPLLRSGQRCPGRHVEHDEVVASAVHLHEIDAHAARIP